MTKVTPLGSNKNNKGKSALTSRNPLVTTATPKGSQTQERVNLGYATPTGGVINPNEFNRSTDSNNGQLTDTQHAIWAYMMENKDKYIIPKALTESTKSNTRAR